METLTDSAVSTRPVTDVVEAAAVAPPSQQDDDYAMNFDFAGLRSDR